MGTFVNGLWHGYGVLHFGLFNQNYYEGEFKDGQPHGYGKWVVQNTNWDDIMSHEGWWEFGSIKPQKILTEESRQARLQIWSQR